MIVLVDVFMNDVYWCLDDVLIIYCFGWSEGVVFVVFIGRWGVLVVLIVWVWFGV